MDIAALKAVSGRLQQRALARLSLKSPPNRIAREDAALDQEAATSILSLIARLEALEEAARDVVATRFDTYRAGNNRQVGIQDDSGEKCWIVPFDQMHALEAALEPTP